MTAHIDQWWQATRDRRLLVQRCTDCGRHQHHPRPMCLSCGGSVEFVEAAGTGTVWSYSDVHRAPAADVPVPYTVALVRLDEGPVILTHLVYDRPRCDDRVRVEWRALAEGHQLPVFTKGT